jgi:hypothetical protein
MMVVIPVGSHPEIAVTVALAVSNKSYSVISSPPPFLSCNYLILVPNA